MDLFNKKKVKKLTDDLKLKNNLYQNLKIEYGKLSTELVYQQTKISELNKIIENYKSENKKLTDWIFKILEESRICTINNCDPFTIPVYYHTDTQWNNNIHITTEHTIIPEIHIVKQIGRSAESYYE